MWRQGAYTKLLFGSKKTSIRIIVKGIYYGSRICSKPHGVSSFGRGKKKENLIYVFLYRDSICDQSKFFARNEKLKRIKRFFKHLFIASVVIYQNLC